MTSNKTEKQPQRKGSIMLSAKILNRKELSAAIWFSSHFIHWTWNGKAEDGLVKCSLHRDAAFIAEGI